MKLYKRSEENNVIEFFIMTKQVIKKDGTKEPFDSGKISRAIEGSARDAGLTTERTSEVVNQVLGAVLQFAASKEEISTAELVEKILGELEKIEPAAAEAWKKHEQEKIR